MEKAVNSCTYFISLFSILIEQKYKYLNPIYTKLEKKYDSSVHLTVVTLNPCI